MSALLSTRVLLRSTRDRRSHPETAPDGWRIERTAGSRLVRLRNLGDSPVTVTRVLLDAPCDDLEVPVRLPYTVHPRQALPVLCEVRADRARSLRIRLEWRCSDGTNETADIVVR
ncbi:hypothetical protein [Leifsonia aquatica]|uniref:hypothetical protein n=1 Tax=Leifsonia aquatica TaxID=144185 RepID=UPI00380276C1